MKLGRETHELVSERGSHVHWLLKMKRALAFFRVGNTYAQGRMSGKHIEVRCPTRQRERLASLFLLEES